MKFGSADLIEDDISPETGEWINVGMPYLYYGTFYNDLHLTYEWQTAEIEFYYVPSASEDLEDPVHTRDSILGISNVESTFPDSILNMTVSDNTTVDSPSNLELDDGLYTYMNRNGTGVYNATYSFSDEIVGDDPTEWTVGESGGTVNVIYELGGHTKVVELDDTDGGNYVSLAQTFTEGLQSTGTVEFWIRSDDVTDQIDLHMYEVAIYNIHLKIDDDKIQYFYGGIWNDATNGGVLDDIWYHIRIVFDVSPDTYDFYLDGVLLDVDVLFQNVVTTGLNKIWFHTDGGDSNYKYYIDAVDYSWTDGYSTYRNAQALHSLQHYNGTYSFTDEYDGVSGTDIEFLYSTTGMVPPSTITIVSAVDEHKKVLQLYDGSGATYASGYHGLDTDGTIANKLYGTMEFWVRTSDATLASTIHFFDGESYTFGWRIDADKMDVWENAGWVYTGLVPGDNTWYHIQFDFEATTGGYKGLAQYDFHLYVNGVHYGDYDFVNNNPNIDRAWILTSIADTGYYFWIDAWGESWDNDYMIGWNREEYAFFGDYNSTYSFENDLIGSNPAGWTVYEGGGTVNIIGSVGNHKKVVELDDTDAVNDVNLVNTFVSVQTSGTIELWINTDDVTTKRTFIYGGGGSNFILFIDGDKWQYYDAHVLNDVGLTAVVNIWYHFKINFDCATDTYDIIIDGIEYQTGVDFYDPAVNIPSLFIGSRGNDQDYKIYLDAVDYSWSPGYSNGRNRLTENDDILGHYPATHSFPFENSGTDIDFVDSLAGTTPTTEIIGAVGEHRKIIYHEDGKVDNYFDQKRSTGTIEFWHYHPDDGKNIGFIFKEDSTEIGIFKFGNYDNKFEYNDGGGYQEVGTSLNRIWYHHRIIWYADDTFDWYIDGVLEVDGGLLTNSITVGINRFQIYSVGVGHIVYLDAIDYSWDPYYSTGRNLNPTVANLLGQYPGIYSFESDLVWEVPNGWVFGDGGSVGYSSANVIAEYDGHRKVIKQIHSSEVGINTIIRSPTIAKTNGFVEFWLGMETGTTGYTQNNINVDGGGLLAIMGLYPDQDRLYWYEGRAPGLVLRSVAGIARDQLHHIKISIEPDTDKFSMWVDGNKIVDNVDTYSTFNYFEEIQFQMASTVDGNQYIDAYSYDGNYLIGDNLHYNNFLGSETFEGYNITESGDYYGTDSFDYNTESDVYYGTYDFRDEADGTSGTSIDFVDFVNLYDGGVEIVSSWQSHNKVLRLQDDATAGEDPHFHHNIVQTTSGTHEFWIGTNDVTKYWEFYTFEGGIGYINRLRISASSISYFDGGAWNVLIAVSNNILYHVQLVWRADNTQDIYINGVLEADNVSTDDNMVSGVNRIFFKCFGDSTDYLYLDAYGETEDTTSHGGLGYTVDYNILSQDIEPILEGGYEIDNIQIGDTLEVVNVLDGHNNVVNITGSTNFAASFDSRSLSIYDTFSQGSGTIEFWGYFYDSPYVNQILFNNNTQIFHNGSFYWRYDDIDVFMVPGLFGQWVHFEIEWSGNDVDVYVNGTKELDTFWSDSDTTLTRIDFMSFDNVSFYVDAVGFSWDSDYDVNDNVNSHGKEVITALENEGWNNILIDPFASIGISGEFNSHKKFLNFTDDTTTGWVSMSDSFTAQTIGTIEFWIKLAQTNMRFYIDIFDGSSTSIILFQADNDAKFDYFNSIGGITTITDYNADQWYHIKIEFDCADDTFDFYLDDIQYLDNIVFRNVDDGSGATDFKFLTRFSGIGIVYIDALSYSWDEPTSYFVGSYNQHSNIEAVIDFVVDVPFDFYEREIMQINVDSRQFTSILANMSFSVYN
ncbi:hypothetical protein LCGC14_1229740, partial [marine sediment metagenome]